MVAVETGIGSVVGCDDDDDGCGGVGDDEVVVAVGCGVVDGAAVALVLTTRLFRRTKPDIYWEGDGGGMKGEEWGIINIARI